jgi:phosphoserine phosphatase RsbU/P
MIPISEAALLLTSLSTCLCAAAVSCLVSGKPDRSEAKPRVLVIDDEAAICDLLSLYLGQQDLEVVTVRSAPEARVFLQGGQFDLVILDWKLDGAEGLDLLQLSKARHPDVPVIIYTGADLNEGSLGAGLAREADAVIRKMGPLNALSDAVSRHLERGHAQARDTA